MKPIRMEGEVAIFTTRMVDDYGYPEIYGYTSYQVIESRDNFVTDYKLEQERWWVKIHRYSRLARFKSTLFQLLGDRGKVDDQAYAMVKAYLSKDSKDLWDDTRRILKHFKLRHCYNRIPKILEKLGYGRLYPFVTSDQIEAIINDYLALNDRFERRKEELSRLYFPSIRFIALKLLDLHSIHPKYKVPFVRTKRKQKSLDVVWESLLSV